jgi:hypothetical protein
MSAQKVPFKMRHHLFGNPAVLSFRTRGFASPDFSRFAFIGDVPRYKSRYIKNPNRAFAQYIVNLISGNMPV